MPANGRGISRTHDENSRSLRLVSMSRAGPERATPRGPRHRLCWRDSHGRRSFGLAVLSAALSSASGHVTGGRLAAGPREHDVVPRDRSVDAERLLGLTHLPILTATPLQFFAESANLIRQRLVRRRAREEPAYPADAVRCRLLFYELCLQDELAKLLQRRLEHLTWGNLRRRMAAETAVGVRTSRFCGRAPAIGAVQINDVARQTEIRAARALH